MTGYLYILKSLQSEKFYIGSTNNLDRRIAQHNANAVSATRNRGPWEFAKTIGFMSNTAAKRAESYLKTQKSKQATLAVISNNFTWPADIDVELLRS